MTQINPSTQKFIQRCANKGTSTIRELEKSKSAWCGTEFRQQEQKRTNLIKNFFITSAKGTKRIDQALMQVPELAILPKRFRFSSEKGTSTRTAA